MNKETIRINIDEEHYTESNYPFTIKPNFSTLGSIKTISTQRPIITFVPDNSIRDPLGYKKTTKFEESNLSPNTVDILSFDIIFLECNDFQGMIFRGERSGVFHNFTMDADLGYKYIEEIRGGVQWYMMESKDIISSICFEVKNENNQMVSFNGQPITFRLDYQSNKIQF